MKENPNDLPMEYRLPQQQMIVVIKMSHFARAHKSILTTGKKAEPTEQS